MGGGGDDPGGGAGEMAEGVPHLRELVVLERLEQLAHLARVQLAEAVDERRALGRQPDEDLAPVGWILAARRETVVDDLVDEAADGGQRHAEALDEGRHVELAGERDEVQELGLGHRDRDLEELRRVAVGEAVHEHLVARDDLVDDDRPGGVRHPNPLVTTDASVLPNHSVATIQRIADGVAHRERVIRCASFGR